MLTLTVKEIADLAEAAGLDVGPVPTDEAFTEYTITDCPKEGLDEDGIRTQYRKIAFITEYPEEGSFGLGYPITSHDSPNQMPN